MFVAKNTKDAEVLLHRLVAKHAPGKHDQKTHGKGGKGGGSGVGSDSTASPQDSEASSQARSQIAKILVDDMSEAEKDLNDLSSRLTSRGEELAVDRAVNNIVGAKKDFNDAVKLKGREQTAKIQRGVGKISAGINQLSMVDDKRADDIAQSIIDEVTSTFGDSNSTFQNLGIDIDDLVGP